MEVVFLLLVVCWSPVVAQVSVPQRDEVRTETGTEEGGRADVPSDPVVLWDELQGLKDLVLSLKAAEVGRRQTLRSVESRLRDREMEAEQQRRSVDGLTETLNQNRKELRSATQRAEADRKLEMDANSELSRKVEELEEQNKGRREGAESSLRKTVM
ncbi:myosin-2 heavy chain-like [Xyrichtys novacula]|uniref:Myosin-2 heavy chain-like n=1 Tax=Xyrichtys novacula TaxID=13765 RepID=A0AAV1GN48_XYRNO|nr:myosin-2 heavy chain-like [Xyrichtys novacula]